MKFEVGQKFVWERTFTTKDIEQFGEISGDRGIHHVRPDRKGRIMVQGLLTATLPTKIGGDLNYIARTLSFEFLRPVFAGDTVRVKAVITHVESERERIQVDIDYVCYNQHGKEVLLGKSTGIVRNPPD